MGIRPDAVQTLTVKGPLNDDDIYFLRDSLPDVERLDLSEALCKELPSSAFAQMTMKEIKFSAMISESRRLLRGGTKPEKHCFLSWFCEQAFRLQ